MKTEILPNKMPDGYGPTGLPIDKDAPPSRCGARIGMNLTVMIDEPINQNSTYQYVIIWNTQTGERTKLFLGSLAQFSMSSGPFVVINDPDIKHKHDLSGQWPRSN